MWSGDYRKFQQLVCDINGNYSSRLLPRVIRVQHSGPCQISIDQSTSQTGLAILDENEELLYLMDFRNNGLDTKDYMHCLMLALSEIFKPLDIRRIVMEEHSGIRNSRWVRKTLMVLAKELRMMCMKIPHLKDLEIATEPPQSWRAGFLTKKAEVGMVKEAVVERCLELYPNLVKYIDPCGESLDSFEALGIIKGHLSRTYTDDGLRMPTKALLRVHHDFTIKVRWNKSPEDIMREFKDIISKRGIVHMAFNPKMTYKDNIEYVTSNDNRVVIFRVDSKKEINMMCLNMNLDIPTSEVWLIGYRDKIDGNIKTNLMDRR